MSSPAGEWALGLIVAEYRGAGCRLARIGDTTPAAAAARAVIRGELEGISRCGEVVADTAGLPRPNWLYLLDTCDSGVPA